MVFLLTLDARSARGMISPARIVPQTMAANNSLLLFINDLKTRGPNRKRWNGWPIFEDAQNIAANRYPNAAR